MLWAGGREAKEKSARRPSLGREPASVIFRDPAPAGTTAIVWDAPASLETGPRGSFETAGAAGGED
jgi:hypothetical protein